MHSKADQIVPAANEGEDEADAPHPEAPAPARAGRIAVASFIGTAIEFYDFFVYGTAAALVLNHIFFPSLSPVAGTLAAFSTYAVAFFARPLGAALFGHFGDRLGRKSVLVVSLLLMGGSTALVGLLPGYATLGMWAPALLVALRFLQGIGLGGEWGGAVLLAVEHAPKERRGRWAAFPQLGPAAGFFASTGVFWLLSQTLDQQAFESWGWRLPFLGSVLLLGVGLFIRLRIAETPVFTRMTERKELSRRPFAEVLRTHRRELLLCGGVLTVSYASFYTNSTYCLSYLTSELGIGRDRVLAMSLAAVCFLAAGTWLGARLSDRVGRRRTVLAGIIGVGLWAPLMFPLLDTRQTVWVVVGLSGATFANGVLYGPIGAYLPELFAPRVRYSGASLGYNLGGIIGGATAPLVAVRLEEQFGSVAIGVYLAGLAVFSAGCLLALPETRGTDAGASGDGGTRRDGPAEGLPKQAVRAEG